MAKIPCAKCGSCTSVCPVYQVTGKESDTARGRLHLLEKLEGDTPSKEYIDIFSRCLLCNACKLGCPRGIDLPSMVIEARKGFPILTGKGSFKKHLAKKTLASDTLLKNLGALLKLSRPILDTLPKNSGLRLKLGIIAGNSSEPVRETVPERSVSSTARNQIFAGCLAKHIYPQILKATGGIISGGTELDNSPPGQQCCGLASYCSGDIDTAKDLARKNIEAFGDSDSSIITPCASCFSHLSNYPEILKDDPKWAAKAEHFVSRLEELSKLLSANSRTYSAPENELKLRVLYHDPCHLRFRAGDYTTPPRKLLTALPGVELVELPRGPRCCGLGGLFNLAHPEISEDIGEHLADELEETMPDIIVSTCSGCLLQLKFLTGAKALNIEVCHLSEFLNRFIQR